MRERLIRMLCGVKCEGDDRRNGGCPDRVDDECVHIKWLPMCQIGKIADHLLANGVIVPPCKLGDTVYMITQEQKIHEKKVIAEWMASGINLYGDKWGRWCFNCTDAIVFNGDDIGKTVFLTKEEAERALKGEW